MDKKIKELIAIGASYALNCKPCMDIHKKKADEAGLTAEEMQIAIGIAEAVKKGAYDWAKKSATDTFGNFKDEKCCSEGSSKCC